MPATVGESRALYSIAVAALAAAATGLTTRQTDPSVAAARPAPLVLGLALVLLLGIPWVLAVAHRLTNTADPPAG